MDENGLLREEVAKVFGVPFEVIPFKANPQGSAPAAEAAQARSRRSRQGGLRDQVPAGRGIHPAIRNRVTVDWASVPNLVIDPGHIPPEVLVKAWSVNNVGRLSLTGPGREDEVSLAEFRSKRRLQELTFDLARVTDARLPCSGDVATFPPTCSSHSSWRS